MTNGSTADRILSRLKLNGPQTARQIADAFDISVMGAHKVLGGLGRDGLVAFEDIAGERGRPHRLFFLTAAGHGRFPNRHADLNTELIGMIRSEFGQAGLDKLIGTRKARQIERYKAAARGTLADRVAKLAELRSAEGYMARIEALENGSYRLIESHCPISAAARTCEEFCRSELDVFHAALGLEAEITREEHLLADGRCCVYRITARKTG